jgi:hypothetical protein
MLPEATLERARAFIALARHADPPISDGLSGKIRDTFVAARAADAKAVTGDTLSRWINLAKLRAQSYGEVRVGGTVAFFCFVFFAGFH